MNLNKNNPFCLLLPDINQKLGKFVKKNNDIHVHNFKKQNEGKKPNKLV